MEKVVYLLGAGFSAPLGLPVMSNFLTKSKDMYYENPNNYPHFQEVFDTIKEMSFIKNYFSTDLFNIEEILSILEMGEYLEGGQLKDTFLKYISDVISHYTPPILGHPPGRVPGNWYDFLFGTDRLWESYGRFVGNLGNITFKPSGSSFTGNYSDIICQPATKPKIHYSIITLNYDLILETVIKFLNDNYAKGRIGLQIAKLHGSIDTGVIVPPTWSKGVNRQIVPAWKEAYKLLTEANHLRIIGYSLPTADAYIKYLLKAAVMNAPHLKNIDVVCLDDYKHSTQDRYQEFITFAYFRFFNANVTDYLRNVEQHNRVPDSKARYGFGLENLEEAHRKFFAG
jgi:hypothetical protein